jgi:hypothetical protein
MQEGGEADCLPIVQYWHDGEPPDYIVQLLESFRKQNPGMSHRVFDQAAAERLIAENFGDREVSAFRSCRVPAMQADYFRYCAALVLGGVCCDADLSCTSGLVTDMPAPGEGWLLKRQHGVIVNGLFAVGSPGHPFLELTVEVVTACIEERSSQTVYMATGPALWTTLYWVHQLGSFDAFIENAPEAEWRTYARFCEERVGGFERVDSAFDRIRIRPVSEIQPFIQSSGMDFPYKETDMHWANFRGGIYKSPLPCTN